MQLQHKGSIKLEYIAQSSMYLGDVSPRLDVPSKGKISEPEPRFEEKREAMPKFYRVDDKQNHFNKVRRFGILYVMYC